MVVVVVVVVVGARVVDVVDCASVVVGANVVGGATVVDELVDGPDAIGDTACGIVIGGTVVVVVVGATVVDVVVVVVDATVVEVAVRGAESDGSTGSSPVSAVMGGSPSTLDASPRGTSSALIGSVDDRSAVNTKLPTKMTPLAAMPIMESAARRPMRLVACSSGKPVDGSVAPNVA